VLEPRAQFHCCLKIQQDFSQRFQYKLPRLQVIALPSPSRAFIAMMIWPGTRSLLGGDWASAL
jgi:hypothetical protein